MTVSIEVVSARPISLVARHVYLAASSGKTSSISRRAYAGLRVVLQVVVGILLQDWLVVLQPFNLERMRQLVWSVSFKVCLFVCSSKNETNCMISVFLHLVVCLFACLCVCLFVCLFACLCVCLFVCCLFVCLFVCLCDWMVTLTQN